MKRQLYTALIALATATALTSCSNWFDVLPRDATYEEDLYSKEIGFQKQATGLYLAMGKSNLYGGSASFGMVDIVSGMYNLQKTKNNTYKYALQYNYEYSGTKSSTTGIWDEAYNVIANADELLRNAGVSQDVNPDETKGLTPNPAFTSGQTRNILVGEALAVRAYVHFDLLRMFGKSPAVDAGKPAIPYVTVLKKELTPQSTVAEVGKKVETDLLQAESLLRESDPIVKGNPAIDDSYYGYGDRFFHMNYYAVCGLLARVYQYMGNEQEAGKWAQKVIDSQVCSWTDLAAINKGDYVDVKEQVFNLFVRDMKDRITPYFRVGDDGNTDNLLPVSASYYNAAFPDGKDRRSKALMQYTDENGNLTYLPQKYVVTTETSSDSISLTRRIPMIRLSEMYYIACESALSQGNLDEAKTLLNTVRKARGLTVSTFDNDPSKDEKSEIQDELANEYRREFIAEGQWFFFIKRKNLPDLIDTQYAVDFVFPLPEAEYTYGNRQPNK